MPTPDAWLNHADDARKRERWTKRHPDPFGVVGTVLRVAERKPLMVECSACGTRTPTYLFTEHVETEHSDDPQ